MSEFKVLNNNRTILNMNHVAYYGFETDGRVVHINVTMVGESDPRRFTYNTPEECFTDWPELATPIRAWIEQFHR